jgi:hypothetical protein
VADREGAGQLLPPDRLLEVGQLAGLALDRQRARSSSTATPALS